MGYFSTGSAVRLGRTDLRVRGFHGGDQLLPERSGAGHWLVATYCPLTNSGALFDATDIDFGNTGALFNNNVVMYDVETSSSWSQMALGSIVGARAGEHLTPLPVAQTTLGLWKRLYPHTQVLSDNTGFKRRNYLRNAFVDFGYTEDDRIFFPQTPEIDPRQHPKEMVFGLARGDGPSIAFTYTDLEATRVVNQVFDGDDIVIFYEPEGRLALGYSRRLTADVLHFSLAGDGDEDAMAQFVDAETGSTWNLTGEAVAGPLDGCSRSSARSLPARPALDALFLARVA